MAKKDHLTAFPPSPPSSASPSSTPRTNITGSTTNGGGGIRLVDDDEERTPSAATKLGEAREATSSKKLEPQPSVPPKDSSPPPPSLLQLRADASAPSMAPKPTPPEPTTSSSIIPWIEHGSPSSLKLALASSKEKVKRAKGSAKSAPGSRTPSASPPTANIPPSAHGRHRGSPSSPANEYAPALPPRPGGPRRSSSQDGNFFSKVKKGKEQVQAGGLKAVGFLDKVGHVAWDRLKSPRGLAPKHAYGRSVSPQSSSSNPSRDASNDVDVFGMDLKEAVIKTRIVKERKMGGDATFWIPAIAYRCLQYLNVYGPHELGIYRISGSTSVVDDLRAEFKIHHDVDLFENPPDDLHTVSSLLKGWFRSLPDAILPSDVQKRIYDKCKDETESPRPPQAFVDELSNLPPYNYYLLNHLFSHLSTICEASNVNKMNLSNLGMIFCSTLRIDRFCFNWLVNSWGDCWAGCLTEEEEYNRVEPASKPPSASSGQHKPSSSSGSARAGTADSSTKHWGSAASCPPPSPPPAPTGHEQQRDNRELQDSQRERMERAAEKERERELERESILESRGGSTSCSVPGKATKRFSTIAEANGGAGQKNDGRSHGKLSAQNMMLPPIQPVSPLMKAEQKIT